MLILGVSWHRLALGRSCKWWQKRCLPTKNRISSSVHYYKMRRKIEVLINIDVLVRSIARRHTELVVLWIYRSHRLNHVLRMQGRCLNYFLDFHICSSLFGISLFDSSFGHFLNLCFRDQSSLARGASSSSLPRNLILSLRLVIIFDRRLWLLELVWRGPWSSDI